MMYGVPGSYPGGGYQGGYYAPPPPQYQPPRMEQPQQMSAPAAPGGPGILWVSCQAEAEGHYVAPNNAVTLWDSNRPCVYLKQADASGRPTMRVYDLVERTAAPQPPAGQNAEFVTRTEFEALVKRLDGLTAQKEETSNE